MLHCSMACAVALRRAYAAYGSHHTDELRACVPNCWDVRQLGCDMLLPRLATIILVRLLLSRQHSCQNPVLLAPTPMMIG